MEIKKTTRLPEGVGKKIIEALKSQSDNRVDEPEEEQQSFDDYIKPIKKLEKRPAQFAERPKSLRQQIVDAEHEEDDEDFYSKKSSTYEEAPAKKDFYDADYDDDEEEYDENHEEQAKAPTFVFPEDTEEDDEENFSYQNYEQSAVDDYEFYNAQPQEDEEEAVDETVYEEYSPQSVSEKVSQYQQTSRDRFEDDDDEIIPQKSQQVDEYGSNVTILMNLVHQLPSGVTKQTGAHIIRQTMEAMGISMNKVVAEAQQIQNDIGDSIRDNINTIEEYRNNIRNLEREVQIYRKKSEDFQELISLFTFTERPNKK